MLRKKRTRGDGDGDDARDDGGEKKKKEEENGIFFLFDGIFTRQVTDLN